MILILFRHKLFHTSRLRNFQFQHTRNFNQVFQEVKFALPKPKVNIEEILSHLDEYKKDVLSRKNVRYEELLSSFLALSENDSKDEKLMSMAAQLPNWVHPAVRSYENEFDVVKVVGTPKKFHFKPLNGTDILRGKDLLKMENLNHLCGEKSYYFTGDLAKLEQGLVNYTVQQLLHKSFIPVSVPDILHENIMENCGMATKGIRTQVYRLDSNLFGPGSCLSGTSEMAIAALLMNSNIPENLLPLNYLAVSRCFRAEISELASERGLYRVHQFTKVEMFGVCLPHQSHDTLNMYRNIQEELFSSYDLHYRVIDMAPHELGCQANRKYDIEAWMPGSKRYGEISSCSNCTDYQSRRLNIRSGDTFLHTINGTACAVPRTINAIVETHQTEQARITVPKKLHPFIDVDVVGMKRGPRLHNVSKIC